MGKHKKFFVDIETESRKEVLPFNKFSLPPFQKYLDVTNGRSGDQLQKIRIYFFLPGKEEIKVALNLGFTLVGSGENHKSESYRAIGEYSAKKLSENFAHQLVQLLVLRYKESNLALNTISNLCSALKHFIDFLSTLDNHSSITIYDISFEDWMKYRAYIINSHLKDKKQNFRAPLSIFAAYSGTNFDNTLTNIVSPKNSNYSVSKVEKPILVNDYSYSDAVMYQLLAQFVYRVERQIEYLKYYENLNIESFGTDWIDPNTKLIDTVPKKTKYCSNRFQLIMIFFENEEGFKKILDHKLMWHKLGVAPDQSFARKMQQHGACSPEFKKKFNTYTEWEKKTHSLHGPPPKSNVFGLYVKRSTKEDKTGNMSQLAFALANLVMIYTGLNKEVVLSWPSKINEKSILDGGDTLFLNPNGKNDEIEITGIKKRTGALTKDKPIRIAIVVDSPLYKMLKDYERYAKVEFNGPFFEFKSKNYERGWGGKLELFKQYIIFDDDGNRLTAVNTTKFRKVFATNKLLEHIDNVKTPQELADRLRSDLHHQSLDITLSNYIYKSQSATSVLDIAIATITSEKIEQALSFQGEIAIDNIPDKQQSTYLCECKDPFNPSHGVSIAKKCHFYDLCLGCKQSIVCKEHLPYICYRILQYEDRRKEMGQEWGAIFEDKWIVAHDTLERYKLQDITNGEKAVNESWAIARSSNNLLPPIIMTKF